MKLNNTSATALTLSLLLAACAGQQPDATLACNSDAQCTGDSLCLSGSCEAAALHRHSTALSVAPATAARTVPAGVKPADGWFSVVNNTVWGHYYAVACDSGATPRPAAGGVDWLDAVKITVDLLPPASGDSTIRCDVTSKSGKTIYGTFALTLHASGGTGDPDGGSSGDFTVAPADASLSIAAGGSAQTVVGVAGTGSFASDVTLYVAGAPKGATASFDSAIIAGGTGAATLTVDAGTAAAGSYTLTVTGTSGALSHSAQVSVAIAGPAPTADFTLSASPAALSLAAGGQATSSVSVAPVANFSADVALTLTGTPAGARAAFDTSTIAGGSGSATLSVSAGTAAAGTYALVLTGTSGSLSHSAQVSVSIAGPVIPADFTVTATPPSLSLAAGGSGTSAISILPAGGFTGAVALAVSGAPKGATATLDTATVQGGSGSATLTVAAGSAAAGTYPLTVTAVSGALTHTAAVSVAIAAPVVPADFAIAASPGSLSLVQGSSGSSAISVSPSNGFASDVALTLSGLPTGSKGSFDKSTIASGSGAATLTISVGASVAVGSYTATVTATGGGLTHATSVALTVTAPAPPPDFSLSAAPGSIAVQQGGASGASTLTVAAQGGFARDVTLTLTGLPAGATGVFSAPTVFGGSGTSTLTVQAATATPGSYTLTVTGSGGTSTHTASLALSVAAPPPPADFSVSASPATLSLGPSTNGTSSIAIAPVNGFTGSVTLSASGVPSGASAAFSSSTVAGSGTSTLTLSSGTAVAGTYTITVAAKSGSLSHSATLSLTLSGPAQCTADTWSNWAHGFFTTNCVGCHSKFDTYANVSSDQSNIQQYISSGVMPQGGSLSAADKTRILKWLSCSLPQ